MNGSSGSCDGCACPSGIGDGPAPGRVATYADPVGIGAACFLNDLTDVGGRSDAAGNRRRRISAASFPATATGAVTIWRSTSRTSIAAAAYLRAQPGVRVLGAPETITDGPIAGDRWVYFVTPWGMQLELINIPAGAPFERETAARPYQSDRPWSNH